MNYLQLTHEHLQIGNLSDLASHETCGAVSLFVGYTRDNFDGKQVVSLEYEAFESMAIKGMNKICDEMRKNWPDIKNIVIYHRLGEVAVKEPSVVIAVSSVHREASLKGVNYAIEHLKKTVPVWKKERYGDADGSSEWKENSECHRKGPRPIPVRDLKPTTRYLNFNDCVVSDVDIAKNLIQINADHDEVQRRINCFVDRKRDEIDFNNVQDFIEHKADDGDHIDYSCARTTSVLYKTKDSKGHLKVRKVKNESGPQNKVNYLDTLDKLMDTKFSPQKLIKTEATAGGGVPFGIQERLESVEQHLRLPQPISLDVYARIKSVENRMLYLESLSPEYSNFRVHEKSVPSAKLSKKVYTTSDLDRCIQEMMAKTLK